MVFQGENDQLANLAERQAQTSHVLDQQQAKIATLEAALTALMHSSNSGPSEAIRFPNIRSRSEYEIRAMPRADKLRSISGEYLRRLQTRSVNTVSPEPSLITPEVTESVRGERSGSTLFGDVSPLTSRSFVAKFPSDTVETEKEDVRVAGDTDFISICRVGSLFLSTIIASSLIIIGIVSPHLGGVPSRYFWFSIGCSTLGVSFSTLLITLGVQRDRYD